MDGTQGYSGAYPASFERVRRQIEIEHQYVPVLTAYAWHNYMHDPAAGEGLIRGQSHCGGPTRRTTRRSGSG